MPQKSIKLLPKSSVLQGYPGIIRAEKSPSETKSSKILLLEACLLPLVLAGFIGSLAVAAKSCSRGVSAAFDLGEFLRVFGGSSKILPLRRGCCL